MFDFFKRKKKKENVKIDAELEAKDISEAEKLSENSEKYNYDFTVENTDFYGSNSEDVEPKTSIEVKEKSYTEEEIHKIENIDEENERTKEKIAKIKEKMDILCDKINAKRIEQSKVLNEKINNELKELEMKNARFNAKVIKDETFSYNGNSHVEFVISTNLGEEEKKLNKIASGGEMSRIMLAIKTVLSDIDEVPVLIFDEIDTGISGTQSINTSAALNDIKLINTNNVTGTKRA